MGETGGGSFFLGFDRSLLQLFLANSSWEKEGHTQERMLESCGNHLSSLPFARLCQSHLGTGRLPPAPTDGIAYSPGALLGTSPLFTSSCFLFHPLHLQPPVASQLNSPTQDERNGPH